MYQNSAYRRIEDSVQAVFEWLWSNCDNRLAFKVSRLSRSEIAKDCLTLEGVVYFLSFWYWKNNCLHWVHCICSAINLIYFFGLWTFFRCLLVHGSLSKSSLLQSTRRVSHFFNYSLINKIQYDRKKARNRVSVGQDFRRKIQNVLSRMRMFVHHYCTKLRSFSNTNLNTFLRLSYGT